MRTTTDEHAVAPARRASARLLRGVVAFLGLVVLGFVGPALPAAAHAGLASSDPAEGAVLASAPRTIQLRFNEPVAPVAAGFALYDSTGRYSLDGEPSTVTVTSVDTQVTAQLPPALANGSYLLSWRVVSADSHPISGVIRFAVGAPSTRVEAPPSADPESLRNPVTTVYLALQVIGYLGLLGAVGLRVFDHLVLSAASRLGQARSRLVALGVGLALAAYTLLVGLTIVREDGAGFGALATASPWQQGLASPAAATLGLAAAGSAFLLLAPRLSGTAARVVALVGAIVAVSSVLPTGHTRTYSPRWLLIGLDVVHAGTAAVWFGGLLGLGLHLYRSRREGGDPVPAAGVLARFSALAGVLVGLLGLSGVVLAVFILGSFRALVTTDYGQALLVKLALVAVIGVLAVWNKAYLVRSITRRPSVQAQWRRLRSAVVDEAALLVLALAVTGLLSMQSPTGTGDSTGNGSVVTAAENPGTAIRQAELGTGSVQGQLQPATVGPNTFEFTLRDSGGGPLESAELPKVTATLPSESLGPLPAEVQKLGVNLYRAELPLPMQGEWQLRVAVRVNESDEPSAVLDVPVAG